MATIEGIAMKVNYEDFRTIIMLINPEKNIVIFPISKSDFPYESADGIKQTKNF